MRAEPLIRQAPPTGHTATVAGNQTVPLVERDVWLLDAIHRAAIGEWKICDFDQLAEAKINEFVGVLDKIQQAAFDGDLPIWGKQAQSDIWRPISREYWEYHGIDWFSMLKGEPEILKTESKKTTQNVGVWWELMTSRKMVDELWPIKIKDEALQELGRLQKEGANEQSELITLREAVIDAWERIRKLPEFDTQPSHSPEFASLRDYYEREPAKLPGIVAQLIFNSTDPPLPIEGIAPPRTVMEVIPEDITRGYMFSDDATEMFDVYDREKPVEQRRRYTNLRVKRTDIEGRVKAIEEDNGKR